MKLVPSDFKITSAEGLFLTLPIKFADVLADVPLLEEIGQSVVIPLDSFVNHMNSKVLTQQLFDTVTEIIDNLKENSPGYHLATVMMPM